MVDNSISPDQFFKELLFETEKQFKLSPIYQKQLINKCNWNYAVCATPIQQGKGIIFGINWGGNDHGPQTIMPTGEGIVKYPFIIQSKRYLEYFWGLDFKTINFNYTNLCFFRSPTEKFLDTEDYKLSIPLFQKYVQYINPQWILSIGGTNMKVLDSLGHLKNIKRYYDLEKKYKGHSGQLWDWNVFSVPHPSLKITKTSRQTIWSAVTEEMQKTTNH